MPEIKRTFKNPPIGLQKAVISRSKSKQWAIAITEWVMKQYFYAPNKNCPCSPRTATNITVIVNTITSEELEICNSCAERYFRITSSSFIEKSLRRIKENIYWGINIQSLCYLRSNHILDNRMLECYQIAIKKRKTKGLNEIRKKVNTQLIIFTAYENKVIFDSIDQALADSHTHGRSKPENIIKVWMNILFEFKTESLDLLKESLSGQGMRKYNYFQIQEGRDLLDKYVTKYWESNYILFPKTRGYDNESDSTNHNTNSSNKKAFIFINLEGLEEADPEPWSEEQEKADQELRAMVKQSMKELKERDNKWKEEQDEEQDEELFH